MDDGSLSVVVLAAGRGERMRSDRPKVMHEVAGQPMIRHVLAAAEALGPARVTLVVGPGMEDVAALAAPHPHVVQAERRGTAHAVLQARARHEGTSGDVLVLCGDTPSVTPAALARTVARRRESDGAALVVLAFHTDHPGPYGRLRLDGGGAPVEIVEAADAGPDSAGSGLCNSGIMAVDGAVLWTLLERVGNDNAKGEYYLTDLVALARAAGHRCAVVRAPAGELAGVNTRAELAAAEAFAQRRLRARAMAAGATLVDPDSVHLAADTAFGRDVTVEPNVFFGPGVAVGDGATIRAFSHLAGVRVGRGATVGPFARVRPGSDVGEDARVGNFVEVKASEIGADARVGHLSYVGDARLGRGVNLGAGTITCNYDGFAKHRTEIGAGAFIGSNTALVAPVSIGAGAVVGAGSTIGEDVADDALTVTRAARRTVDGGGARYRRSRRRGETD